MGLDTTHNTFHGSYSAFNRFRKFVLESIGGSFPPHNDRQLDCRCWYFGEDFDGYAYKGLYEFFSHSDCDGEIDPEMCKMIADELESILPQINKLSEIKKASGHILNNGGYVETTKQFINGCRLAYKRNEPLKFE